MDTLDKVFGYCDKCKKIVLKYESIFCQDCGEKLTKNICPNEECKNNKKPVYLPVRQRHCDICGTKTNFLQKLQGEHSEILNPTPYVRPVVAVDENLLESAVDIVLGEGKASTSFLQRRLKVGYSIASALIDKMEEIHIVGPSNGSKPRDILMTKQQWFERQCNSSGVFDRDRSISDKFKDFGTPIDKE